MQIWGPGSVLIDMHGLAKRHDICRNLIRVWVQNYEAGDFNEDAQAADLLQQYEANIAALEQLVGKQALELEFLKGAVRSAPRPKSATALSEQTLGPRTAVLVLGHEQPVPLFQQLARVIRLVVMMYVRYPLSLRNVEDLLAERGIDISHETVRFWWNRFGPIFAAEIRKRQIVQMRAYPQLR